MPEENTTSPMESQASDRPDGSNQEDNTLGDAGQRALERMKQELKAAKNDLYSLRSRYSGLDLDEYEALKSEKTQREEEELRKQKAFEKLEQSYKEKLADSSGKVEALKKDHENLRLKFELVTQYYAQGGIDAKSSLVGKSNFEILFEAMAPRLRREEDGSLTVLDPSGDEDYTKDGKPKTVADLIDEFSQDSLFGKFFAPKTTANGTGAHPASGNRSRPRQQSFSDWAGQKGFKLK